MPVATCWHPASVLQWPVGQCWWHHCLADVLLCVLHAMEVHNRLLLFTEKGVKEVSLGSFCGGHKRHSGPRGKPQLCSTPSNLLSFVLH